MSSFQDCRSFVDVYHDLLGELLRSRREEVNSRTGRIIRMLDGGCSFRLDVSDKLLPVPGRRRVYPKTAAAEVAWFLRAERSVRWLERYAKIWSKFVEADGETVDASYGYRWRRHFGRDQMLLAIGALSANPTDRRVFVSAWDPGGDGLGAPNQKNVPCPVGFTFSITPDRRLHSSVLIRSSDVFVGLPYDVMGHAILMQVVASSIEKTSGKDLPLGTMQMTLAHPHLYEPHFEMAMDTMRQVPVDERPTLQPFDIWAVDADPDALVDAYEAESAEVNWCGYAPRPELVT